MLVYQCKKKKKGMTFANCQTHCVSKFDTMHAKNIIPTTNHFDITGARGGGGGGGGETERERERERGKESEKERERGG